MQTHTPAHIYSNTPSYLTKTEFSWQIRFNPICSVYCNLSSFRSRLPSTAGQGISEQVQTVQLLLSYFSMSIYFNKTIICWINYSVQLVLESQSPFTGTHSDTIQSLAICLIISPCCMGCICSNFLNNNHTFSNNYFWKEKKSDYSYLNIDFNSIQSQLKHSVLSKM